MKLTHPDTRRTITVREDMVDIYESQGWTRAPASSPAKKAASKRAAKKAAATPPPAPPA